MTLWRGAYQPLSGRSAMTWRISAASSGVARSSAALVGGSLYQSLALAAKLGDGHPLAPRPAHHAPRATNLVMIFLTGGFSHVDTFDPKPRLSADSGKTVSAESLRDVTNQPLLGTPFKFTPAGESGLEISELFPHLAAEADKLTVERNAQPAHVLLDPKGQIGRLYGAKVTPHMFIIGTDGNLLTKAPSIRFVRAVRRTSKKQRTTSRRRSARSRLAAR